MILINEKPLSQIEKEREEEKAPLVNMGQDLAALKISNAQKDAIIQQLEQDLAREKQRNKDNGFAIMELYEALEVIKGGQ
ncbi:hypothetical protein [Aneurinibacillus aneurinilyticus]|uniref:Uncharacterized protein n=1 Tax=Aneurinibacillus aneurinilyticus ATCC 12856 TaxID=649747 RepID=U1X7A2_ANEAE|nr:hypothetical protein [Aneurinibacillus aneurinilyticus]ERI10840.1 hypothetical protein HMPREF0083_01096 [Aneurinibacillus aneurinilyticus ATCC 12856]MED0705928.1 hypothetical protein [Aneurinibacillus aneurinilyticus]MED0722683.1 hypothetical protein [Aneurinibacillus aneurinilyticus]MED0731397.1 hypothetical protein [Aneurinibacillus aneurinilyticus]MED0740153.1 hypothetical protein [Aneurinibacillus aneurinilyticus]